MTRWIFCWLLVVVTAAQGATNETRWERSALEKKQLAREVVWTTHEPPEFLQRRGDHFDDEAAHYAQMYTAENLQRMADAGVRWGRLYFYKGFGLEYERANMEKTKAAAAIMHKLGMKVALYMAGTMFTETLYHELPEAKSGSSGIRMIIGCHTGYRLSGIMRVRMSRRTGII